MLMLITFVRNKYDSNDAVKFNDSGDFVVIDIVTYDDVFMAVHELKNLLQLLRFSSFLHKKDLAREFRLSPLGKETLSQGLFGGKQTPETEHYQYTINVERIDGKFSCQMSVTDQPKICTTPSRVRDKHFPAGLENHGIVLTDIGEETPPIRLLLGADVLGRILLGKIEVLKSGISAIETSFGWSILGSEKKTTLVNIVTLCV
ncbi:hypothetical protein AVEN_112210-1 [Araneus ventricosus]|uniref:Peptidase aspartic putative domain-containing protein n=1 Tax=Araneus ventricosus TaxID=182803 RepID=A0A4Y2SHV0_ARAVE|nr:hypothetical protein AVEN_112210-1 [Araneus ventricosus]